MDVNLILENLEKILDLLADIEMEPEDRETIEFLIREIEDEVKKK